MANVSRSLAGAEIDLLLTLPNQALWAFEIERGLAPKLRRGFHHAAADCDPLRGIVTYPGTETHPMEHAVIGSPPDEATSALLAVRA